MTFIAPSDLHSTPFAGRLRGLRALVPLALFIAPLPALAEAGDNIKIEIDPDGGSYDDLDPIGIDACTAAMSRNVTLTATITGLESTAETRKFIFVTRKSDTDCPQGTLEAAANDPGVDIGGCTYLGGTPDYDTKAQVELKDVALRTLLPDGGLDACTNNDQTIYYFRMTVVPNPEQKRAKGWAVPGAKAVDAGTADAAVDAASADETFTSTTPLELEIDLKRPETPTEGYALLSNDESLVIDFPADESSEITKYQVCWESGAAGSGCKTSSDLSDLKVGTSDGLKLETTYAFTAAAIDDAANLGSAVSIGSGAPRDFLDLAQYYRQMHGPETGGCRAMPGRTGGLVGGLLVGLALVFVRRRSKSSCV